MRRLGLWALPAAGLLYTLGVALRGRFVVPKATNAAAFSSWASTARYSVSYWVVIAAAVLAIVGYVALDRRLASRLSGAASLLAVAGAGVLLALFGVLLVAFPAAANAGGTTVAVKAYSRATPLEILASLNIAGHLLFAVALWRRSAVVRAGAVAFAAAPILQAIVSSYPVELVGQVLFLLGAAAIVVGLGADSPMVTATEAPAVAPA